MAHQRRDFIGSWTLHSWRIEKEKSAPRYPYGPDAEGILNYGPTHMTGLIVAAGRPRLEGATPKQAPLAQQGEAFRTVFGYAGTWSVEGDTMVHHVTVATNPNQADTDQRRHATFDGDLLRLVGDDGPRTHIIEWRRAAPPTDGELTGP